jgi:Holliday junction resolvase-like predicted endonuclease
MKIVKSSGAVEEFSSEKLCDSIVNVGASDNLTAQVCGIVGDSIESGMSTENIFRITRNYLMEVDPGLAAIYSLDRGLSALGPSGFIFEQYVAALFEEMGYDVQTNYYAKGEVVEHEVDVLATKGNVVFVIEAKYRNDYKTKTHINQVMYADARIEDIRRRAKKDGDTREYYLWVVTNTQFTDNAMNYVKKRDLQLMGWEFPRYINIKKIAYEKKLYPVTVLPSITKSALKQCAKEQLILAKDLFPLTAEELQEKFGISQRSAKKLEQEILELMF